MEAVSWSPPVPSGGAATAAWRNLDRRTRRELLQGMGPHPDPFVAGVAVRYARTKLQGRMASTLHLVVFLVAVGLLTVYSFVVPAPGGGYRALEYVPAIVLPPIVLVLVVVGRRFRLGLIRMENLNAPMLLAGQPMPPPGVSTPLSVAYDWRATVLLRATWNAGAWVFLVNILLHMTNENLWAFNLNLLALSWVVVGYRLVMLPGRQVLVVDGQGVRFDGNTVPWGAVTEVHIHRERRSGFSAARPVISFICVDPEAVIAQMRGRLRRKNARSFLRWYGSPFVFIMVLGLDRTVEEVIASVTSFRPVPVRRFDIWGR